MLTNCLSTRKYLKNKNKTKKVEKFDKLYLERERKKLDNE